MQPIPTVSRLFGGAALCRTGRPSGWHRLKNELGYLAVAAQTPEGIQKLEPPLLDSKTPMVYITEPKRG